MKRCKAGLYRNQPCVESRCKPGHCLYCFEPMRDTTPATPLIGQCLDAEGDRRERCAPIHPSDLRGLRFKP
jgi:hypothetical protein